VPTDVLEGTLGIGPSSLVTVALFSVEDGAAADDTGVTVLAERAAGIIALYCEAFRRQAATVAMGTSVYVLLPHGESLDRAALLAFVTSVVDRSMDALRARMAVAVGSTVPLADVASSRAEADRVLRAVRIEGRQRQVATMSDVRSVATLLELQELALRHPRLREGKLQFLTDHDRDKGTEYVPTLRAYLDAFGDVPRAAAAVNVHPNTFRYRLRRLTELAALDLDDPVERLVVSLQIALADLA
jgi:DNA-binding PucR family transcriptional regulator